MIKHRIYGRRNPISLCNISAEVGAALIGAGASVANATGGILTAKKNRQFTDEQNQKSRAWSESMMDKIRAQELEDREHEERYNSPAMQKLRLQLAGLSPEGTFSQMVSNSVAGDTEMASSPMPSDFNPNGIGQYVNPIASGIDGFRQMAEIANINANTTKQKAETKTEDELRSERLEQLKQQNAQYRENIAGSKLSNEAQAVINRNLDRRINAEIENTETQSQLNQSQKALCDKEFEKMDKYIQEMMPAEIAKLGKENGLLDKKMLESEAYCNQLEKLCELYDSQIDEIASKTDLNKLDVENYYYNKNSGGFMGTGLSLGNISREVDNKIEQIKNKRKNRKNPTDSLSGRK